MHSWTKGQVRHFLIATCAINNHDVNLIVSNDIDGETIIELDLDMLSAKGFQGYERIHYFLKKWLDSDERQKLLQYMSVQIKLIWQRR